MKDLLILGIDTSGKTASAALCEDGVIVAQTSLYTGRTHSQVMMPLCSRMLKNAGRELADADLFAVCSGPGSYTGLRIGIAAVKAMAFAFGKSCCGISTLETLANNVCGFDGVICSIMKAREDIYYAALFCRESDALSGNISRISEDAIMSDEDLFGMLNGLNRMVMLVGDGADAFSQKHGDDFLHCAPLHLRYQLPSSLCMAALNAERISPQQLNASYLQLTKAEKDLKLTQQ